uniref:SAP domain-containing protein n=1 Tax=viral metagenome TaxID=1070528 RepID=A0A6C0FD87_9ZZZZ|tara:strand:- start:28002 stop:28748 length:747 start_codon:yes stop_codon:yes gene_type:complete
MSAELSFDSNIIQLLLVIGIIILVAGYFYYENIKIKNQLLEFEYKLSKLNDFGYSEDPLRMSSQPHASKQSQQPQAPQQLHDPQGPQGPQELSEFNIQMEPMINNITESLSPEEDRFIEEVIEKKIHEVPQGVSEGVPKVLPEKDDSEWSDIDKQMKNDNILTEDKKENPSDPAELESFSIDEMLKDISDENKDENNSEKTDKIIDISGDKDYKNMTVSQLKDILIEKNLPVSGNKTKLVQRILDNDK